MSLKTSTFYNRIKRVMQSDQDVGKVAAGSTYIVACALEAFLDSLLHHSVELASNRGTKLMTIGYIKAAVNADPLLDFCTDLASSAPDLPPEDDTKNNRKRPTEVVDEKRAEKRASRGSKQSQAKGRSMAVNQAGTKLKTEAPGTELKDEDEDADDTAPKLEQEEQELVTKNEITKHESIAAVDLEAPVALVDFAPGKEAEDEDYDA